MTSSRYATRHLKIGYEWLPFVSVHCASFLNARFVSSNFFLLFGDSFYQNRNWNSKKRSCQNIKINTYHRFLSIHPILLLSSNVLLMLY